MGAPSVPVSTKERIDALQKQEAQKHAFKGHQAKQLLNTCFKEHYAEQIGQYQAPVTCEELLLSYVSLTDLDQLMVV